MTSSETRWQLFGLTVLLVGILSGCTNGGRARSLQRQAGAPGESLYDKYGGQKAVHKIVDDTVNAVIADCVQNPYFTDDVINFDDANADGQGHGDNGHDTADRLKSCLDAQFTAALGGPSKYTGNSKTTVPSRINPNQTYECGDMMTVHAQLGIPSSVFDQFVSDVGTVLAQNGMSQADIETVATTLVGLEPTIVASPGAERTYNYQPGEPSNPPGVACSVIPSPGPSETPDPEPSAASSPTRFRLTSHPRR
jgi:hypothetical protein